MLRDAAWLYAGVASAQSPGSVRPHPAQRVFKNGFIYTVDSTSSAASAVAIRGGKFVYVGTNAGVRRFIGPKTRVVDLKGKMALPGFIDSHMHFTNGGIADLYELQIPQGMPTADYAGFIKTFADAHPDLAAIRGWGWDIAAYVLHGPLKETLDAVVSDRPVAIQDSSLHLLWCNSKALELAGITKDTPDPPYGHIERDPVTGEPSGTLYESAAALVTNALPQYTVAQYKAAITHFQKDVAARVGLTTVFDPRLLIGANSEKALEQMAQDRKLTIRVRGALLMDPDKPVGPQLQAAAIERSKHRTPLFRTDTLKFFIDGVAFSSYMLEPFSNAVAAGYPADYRGYAAWDEAKVKDASARGARRGFQLHYHAIGDAAVRIALDTVQAAETAAGSKAIRAGITHNFWVDPVDMPRFGELKVVAVEQPTWMEKDWFYYNAYVPSVGTECASRAFPMKSFFDQGVTVASSTDYPISPPDPLDGIATGVTRWNPLLSAPGDILAPEERVTVRQMIRSYTINGARANFLEKTTGSIVVGKSADLVVLDRNILDIPAEEIFSAYAVPLPPSVGRTTVLMTISQGRLVFKSADMD